MSWLRVLSVVVSLGCGSLRAQTLHWHPTDGPWYGWIDAVAANDSAVLATSESADLYRSTDFGEHWVQLDTAGGYGSWWYDLDEYNLVFYGDYGRSTDSGITWTSQPGTTCFAFDSITIFSGWDGAAGYGYYPGSGGIWRSSNNGVTWTECDSGFPKNDMSVFSLALRDSILFAGSDSAIYRSTDRGATWNVALQCGAIPNTLTIIGSTVFAGLDSGQFSREKGLLVRSTDNGVHWVTADSSRAFRRVVKLLSFGDTVFAGTADSGIYRSFDKGVSWSAVDSGLANLAIGDLKRSGATLWIATGIGIYRSTNDGAFWTPTNRGIRRASTVSLALAGSTLLASAYPMFHSSDEGITWVQSVGDLAGGPLAVKDSMVFAPSKTGVCRSTDRGITWHNLPNLFPTYAGVESLLASGNSIFAGTYKGLFRSDDDGTTWRPLTNGLGQGEIISLAANATSLFAGLVDSGAVFRSTDEGSTWVRLDSSSFFRPDVIVAFGDTLLTSNLRSTDNGTTWQALNAMPANCFAMQGNTIFAGVGGGVERSTDGGITWMQDDTGITEQYLFPTVQSIAISGNTIFTGTDYGVFKSSLSELAAVSPPPAKTSSLLLQPNPATNSILMHCPSTKAEIRVWNMLGLCVLDVATNGKREMSIDVSALPSGAYTVTYRSSDRFETQPLLIER